MPAIAPSPLERDVPGRVIGCLDRVLRGISQFAGRLPGQDSVSKLDELERFRLETPAWKVALILLLTPLPWLIINLLLEFIPLNDPATGFWGSGCYQLRMFFISIFSSIAPAVQKLDCVPGFPVRSVRALTVYGLFQGFVCIGTNMIISLATGVFPVPFSQFTVILPMVISGRIVFFRKLPDDPQFHALSDKVNQWLGMETLPILVYPVFTAVFMILSPSQQLWMSLMLPILKLTIRGALWYVARYDDDLVGVITCCVGHLYHVLFTAMILQNAKSLETLGVVVLFSTVQMLFNCRCIFTDSNSVIQARIKAEPIESTLSVRAHLQTALRFAQEIRIAQNLHLRSPSLLLSTYMGYRSATFMEQNQEMLRAATAVFVYNRPKTAAVRGLHSNVGDPKVVAVRKASATAIPTGISRIFPWTNSSKLPRQMPDQVIQLKPRSSLSKSPRSHSDPSVWANAEKEEGRLARHEAVIHQVASALHQSELILLRSYVTICMTLFYVIYLQVVFRLNNRHYFATLVYLTTLEAVNQTAQRLLLICAMEIVFLGIYLLLIERRLGVSGVYQLAFVLWSQRVLVQAKLYVTTIILGFPLTHNGNDSILRFNPVD
ncbi:hypothetical protein PC129_g16315 [Phytophthora cactorum]|uniref:Uncharacterized protein n=1 Tax=Phytophthora cactorum TaxID=29920 RepID=A0A329S6Z6_9STRA|nr:hypothetical protein Pcac1_g27419 [Phytophthora cactorum]KAG2886449.1 hypothetical protein PC114_g19249 [Phytophthora cactorum]KAG2947678.1 hypothetical protein PC117_g6626 [Phytophthora cactorum]KAG3141255.1 hypothetical protein C6341_g19817 [Phytophthora cactorum]KAG3212732.1 hypothetical protein PC129_g16315 [Phytophthora cactorum]